MTMRGGCTVSIPGDQAWRPSHLGGLATESRFGTPTGFYVSPLMCLRCPPVEG